MTALAGRYELGELIGVGASALVYRAEDLLLRRTVAVKLYPAEVAEPDRIRRTRELSLLAPLNHPNLVRLLDAGEDAGRTYLVMELVDGPDLSERLRSAGPMPAAAVARLGAALADALDHVHRRGITHRDVKPGNVLLGERPMLADFGIARLVDTSRITQTGYLIGTPAYLAPEQISGGEVAEPADVYALGLVLLEALTGRREFEGAGPEAAFARLSRRPEIPDGFPGLTDLLRAMTDPEPGARPAAVDVAAALRRAEPALERAAVGPGAGRGGPGPARSVPVPARAVPAEVGPDTSRMPPLMAPRAGADSRWGRRRPLVVTLIVLLATVAGTGAAVLRPVSDEPVPPSSAPVSPAPAKQRVTPTPQRSVDGDRRDSGDENRDGSRSSRDDSSRSSRENGSDSSSDSRNRDSEGSGSEGSGSEGSDSEGSGSEGSGSEGSGGSGSSN